MENKNHGLRQEIIYFPKEVLKKFGLKNPTDNDVERHFLKIVGKPTIITPKKNLAQLREDLKNELGLTQTN